MELEIMKECTIQQISLEQHLTCEEVHKLDPFDMPGVQTQILYNEYPNLFDKVLWSLEAEAVSAERELSKSNEADSFF